MKQKEIIFWLITIIITLASVVYQRKTGPTYPLKGEVNIGSEIIKFRLLRSYGGPDNAEISIDEPSGKINGTFTYKRYKSLDEWTEVPMIHQGGKLVAYIPHQPPAGKVIYDITLTDGVNTQKITEETVVLRFKGDVPAGILIPHILFMFLAMLISTRAGIEAIANGTGTMKYAFLAMIFLIGGGLILGPLVQKHAFDAYWTGWPFKGIFSFGDMTDNKTAIAALAWIVAVIMLKKNSTAKGWVIAAAIIMLMVYLVPHSMFGSEIDHTAIPKIENRMLITYIIIAITAVTSFLAFSNRNLSEKLLFSPYMISYHKQGYRFLTHALVHGDWMHLLVNMFVLLSFGQAVETYFTMFFGMKGAYLYTLLYIGGVVLSSTPSYAKYKSDQFYRAVGASGAVSAVVFASILIQPLSPIRFAFLPIDIPAFIFGAMYLGYSAYMARKGTDNIGHDAHFWGAVFGIIFTGILKPALFSGFIDQIGNFFGH